MATSSSGGRSRSTQREPPTMGKQLVNLSRVHPFCNLQSQARTHAVLVIGLYELLNNPTTQIVQDTCLIRDRNCLFFPWKIDTGRRVWRYHRGNQNPYIEEEQTTRWPKEKIQKDKQRSTKHTYKTKDRVTQTLLNTGGRTQVLRKGRQFLLH